MHDYLCLDTDSDGGVDWFLQADYCIKRSTRDISFPMVVDCTPPAKPALSCVCWDCSVGNDTCC